MIEPLLFAEFYDELTPETNRLRSVARNWIDAAQAEIQKIDRDLDMLVDLVLRGGSAERINAKMLVMEQRKRDLEARLAQAQEPPPLLHPEMAIFYRRQAIGDGERSTRRLERHREIKPVQTG